MYSAMRRSRLFGRGLYAPLILLSAVTQTVISAAIAPLAYAADATAAVVDATTIHGKVMAGYQGWFRCPGDAAQSGWIHWSGDPARIAPETLTFEMWPDMTEYGSDERFPAPGFSYSDGAQASLFSDENPKTVRRHFDWMAQYGIHGVWLQHFLVDLPEGPNKTRYPSRMRVLENVRAAANATGRVWAIAFDMAAMPTTAVVESITAEWKRIADAGIPNDERYLHQDGRPVVMVWGFYRNQNITPDVANRVIDFFKNDPKYKVFLAGGCEWEWRTNPDPQWAAFLRRFDAICPWNVGNYTVDDTKTKWASTGAWKEDVAEAKRAGMLYIPVFYPGFSWDNLKKAPAGSTNIARSGGAFFWKQIYTATQLECDMGYVAMFDEVDEGTAIFKVTNHPPAQAHFVTYEGLPSDWYLHLAGEGAKMLLRQRPLSPQLPR